MDTATSPTLRPSAQRLADAARITTDTPADADAPASLAMAAPTVSPLAKPHAWPTLEEAAFHGLAGEIVKTIEPHSESDPAALLVQLLVALGNIVGRKPHFCVEADKHTMNLFLVIVGDTSKARKGTSWGHILNLFQTVDPSWAASRVVSGLASGEGLIWEVRDPITKREPEMVEGKSTGQFKDTVIVPGVEDKRLCVVESEFARLFRVMAREGSTLSAIIRQAWDTGALRSMTKNDPAKATGAHISMIGHVTREEIVRVVSTTEAANGFCNRYNWVMSRRSKPLPEGGNIDSVDWAPLRVRLREAVDFAKNTGRLTRDEETRLMWKTVYEPLSEGKPGLLGAIVSRAEAQVLRLSCLYALLDCSAIIQRAHLEAALAVWDYCEQSARYIFGERLGDPVADELRAALRDHPTGMTRTEIQGWFGRNRRASELAHALQTLEVKKLAHKTIEQTDGRTAERWWIGQGSTKETN